MSVGQVNFGMEDDPRYLQQGRLSDTEITQYTALRNQPRQRPVEYRPSVLDNGEFVTM